MDFQKCEDCKCCAWCISKPDDDRCNELREKEPVATCATWECKTPTEKGKTYCVECEKSVKEYEESLAQ